jgi:hypothetical protein
VLLSLMRKLIRRTGRGIDCFSKKENISSCFTQKELIFTKSKFFFNFRINLRFAKNIFFYSLPEDPTTFKEMIDLIKPSHYKESLEKYKIEDKNSMADNYSAVISLVTNLEKYGLEKVLGLDLSNHIFKNKIDNYMMSHG